MKGSHIWADRRRYTNRGVSIGGRGMVVGQLDDHWFHAIIDPFWPVLFNSLQYAVFLPGCSRGFTLPFLNADVSRCSWPRAASSIWFTGPGTSWYWPR